MTKRLLSPEALQAAAEEVQQLADEQGVHAILVGGLAMQHYGSDRLTADIDFAAAKRLRGLPRGKPLVFGGEAITLPGGVPLDLIVRRDDFRSLYEAAIEDPDQIASSEIVLARAEYLAAMKMVAGRPKDEEDLRHLITSGHLDRRKAKAIIRKHLGAYAVREFENTIEEAEWIASRVRK